MPAPPADASRCPRGDRVRREPEGDVASPHEGSVVLGPVPDAIRCRVLRMHSRFHIEIMTRLRSRWSTCRPLLAHRAESAHQLLILPLSTAPPPRGRVLVPPAARWDVELLLSVSSVIHDRPSTPRSSFWTVRVPPVPHGLMADVDAALTQKIFDLSQRYGVADIHHDREADDLRRTVEITKGIVHHRRL